MLESVYKIISLDEATSGLLFVLMNLDCINFSVLTCGKKNNFYS